MPHVSDTKAISGPSLGPLAWKIHRFVDAYFTADADAVQPLLPNRLRPIRWRPNRTVISLASGDWEWWTGSEPICRSGTVTVNALVVRESSNALLAMLRGMRVGGPSDRFEGGSFPLHVLTTSVTSLDLFRRLFGVPGSIADVRHEQRPTFERFISEHEGHLITDLTVSALGRAKSFTSSKDRGFAVRESRLVGYYGEADGTARSRLGPNAAQLRLGEHPFSTLLRSLGLSQRPLASGIWLQGEQRMVDAGVDFGPVIEEATTDVVTGNLSGRLIVSHEEGDVTEIEQELTGASSGP